jgi:DNA-binding GntR family transcriptional regulator
MPSEAGRPGGLIPGPSLREQARDFIRGAIVSGQMKVEELYSAPRLAAELRVSVTPVREALLDLAREGLLEPVRNRGFRVVNLSAQELNDIYAIRLLLEVPSVAEAARRGGSSRQIAELRELAEAAQRLAGESDLIAYLRADRKFHIALIDIVANQALSDLVASLRDRVRLYGLASAATRAHVAKSVEEHFSLLRLVEAGEPEKAARLMRQHLERSRDVWAKNVERTAPSPLIQLTGNG